jgi:hypothetical protein
MADLLGDPNFPQKAMKANRGLQIAYFQGLFKQYSRLKMSRIADRPLGIAGLEQRLQTAFGTHGAFGIFDDTDRVDGGLFHRSLLWIRGTETDDAPVLTRIEALASRSHDVPSWSWMAYDGGIDYIDPPFQSADWERDIVSPWAGGKPRQPVTGGIVLRAPIHVFRAHISVEDDTKVVYDMSPDEERYDGDCVVIARSKNAGTSMSMRCYVLFVRRVETGTFEELFERIGAGYVSERSIFELYGRPMADII